MDKSIIKDIVFKSEDYLKNVNVLNDKEYRDCTDKLNALYEKLCNGMSDEEKQQILWDVDILQGGIEAVVASEYFKAGFKLGLTVGAQNFLD